MWPIRCRWDNAIPIAWACYWQICVYMDRNWKTIQSQHWIKVNTPNLKLLVLFLETHNFNFTLRFVRCSAYVKFRNASQDERLSIITRMNLLELIELRAKSWQISDGLNTYYKHKASDVQVTDPLDFFQPCASNKIIIVSSAPFFFFSCSQKRSHLLLWMI